MVSMSKDSETKVCSCESIKQQERELEAAALALCNECALDLDRTATRVWRALRKEYVKMKDATPTLSRTLKEHLEGLLDSLELHDKGGSCEEHGGVPHVEKRCAPQGLWLAINERGQWRLQMTKEEALEYGYEAVTEEEVLHMVHYIRKVRCGGHPECQPQNEKSTGECHEKTDIATQTPVVSQEVPPSSPENT